MGCGGSSVCILMACADSSEADHIARHLSKVNSACFVTYRRAEDLLYNAPTGKIALIILATNETPMMLSRTLQWLRKRWPSCPLTVIGDHGGGIEEITARMGGALYLTRPVGPQLWNGLLTHVLRHDERETHIEGLRADVSAQSRHDE